MMKKILFLLSLFFLLNPMFGQQITVVKNITPQVLVGDTLVSGCVEALNINYTGHADGIGYFNSIGTAFDTVISNGIILASGDVNNAIGPNNSGSISTGWGTPGDADLDNLIPQTTNDAAVLTFDFVPSSDTLTFNYVFGSDEYLEYVNSSFNDVFAFLLTGPNPAGGNYVLENIAVVPGTTTAVSINNVNTTSWPTYYVVNGTGASPDNEPIQYDGFTYGLSATALVTPCETYYIKLAVADAGDTALDSGVFLEAGSFTDGGSATLNNVNPAGTMNDLYEGCESFYIFSRTDTTDTSFPLEIQLTFGGTATNGTDITLFPNVITIPIGQVSDTIFYEVFSDNQVEPTETFIINIMSGCPCNPEPVSDTITIYDYVEFKASIINTDSLFCGMAAPPTYDIVATCVSHPAWFIDYTWNTGSTDSIITVIPPAPGQHDIYWVEIADICGNYLIDSITVGVSNLAGLNLTTSNALCFGACNGEVNVTPITIGPTPGKYYDWSDPGTPNTIIGNRDDLCYGTYTVTLTDSSYCAYTETFSINQPSWPLDASSGLLPVDTLYCSDPGIITLQAQANIPQVTFSWNGGSPSGNTQDVNPIIGQNTYYVDISDFCGFTITDTVNIYYSNISQSSLTALPTTCYGVCDGTVSIVSSSGVPPFEYFYGSNLSGSFTTTESTVNTLCPDIYNVNVVDAAGCIFEEQFVIEQPDEFIPEEAYILNSNTTWCGTTPPTSLQLEATSNLDDVNYTWSNGSTQAYLVVTPTTGYELYTVTIADNCGNEKIDSIAVIVSDFSGVNLQTTNASCYNSCDGSIQLSEIGGIAPFEYLWAGGIGGTTQSNITNLCEGNYAVTVIDAGGCEFEYSFEIEAPEPLSESQISNTNTAYCGVTPPASITIQTEVTTAVDYLWSNGATTSSITFAPQTGANLFWVEFTDICGNSHRDSIVFSVSNFSGANLFTEGTDCYGSCNGQVTVSPLFGITPYSFDWSVPGVGVTTTATLNNICSGTYDVTVSDEAGCSVVKPFTITQPDSIQWVWVSSDAASAENCNGFASATQISGGVPPFTFLWNNSQGSTTYNVQNLCPGLYTITVTDSESCSVTDTIRIGSLVSIEENLGEEALSIYPNPNHHGTFFVELPVGAKAIEAKVYDALGRIILQLNEKDLQVELLELRGIPVGSSILSIEFENRASIRERLIVLEP